MFRITEFLRDGCEVVAWLPKESQLRPVQPTHTTAQGGARAYLPHLRASSAINVVSLRLLQPLHRRL